MILNRNRNLPRNLNQSLNRNPKKMNMLLHGLNQVQP